MIEANLSSYRVPDVRLGYLDDGEIRSVSASKFFAEGRTIILGIPGAYTPVCSTRHVPDFVQSADRFKTLGFNRLVCIAPNDPFVLDAWSREMDPERKLRFLSDGNLEFTHELALESVNPELFVGMRSERYLMVVEDGNIVRLRIEPNILTYSCSTADDALSVADALDVMMV